MKKRRLKKNVKRFIEIVSTIFIGMVLTIGLLFGMAEQQYQREGYYKTVATGE